MVKEEKPMDFCEYVHINSRITEHIHRLYKKGMPIEYLCFNVNHIFGLGMNEKEIKAIIDFNLKTEIYD